MGIIINKIGEKFLYVDILGESLRWVSKFGQEQTRGEGLKKG
jgi:hypothetical protein